MAQFYEQYWTGSDGHFGDFPLKWPKLSALIPKEKNITIMEFGCGKGVLMHEMRAINPDAHYIGLDVSATALTDAKTAYPWADFKHIEDGGAFPLEDKSVDFILTSEVIEHVYDTENAFRELSRVTKSGGKIALTTPHHGFWKNLALVFFGFERHFNPFGPHVRFFTKHNLLEAFRTHGFEIERVDYYGRFYPLSNSIIVVARKK